MKKHAKGITLIALVITIIVLLILAGVVINLTLGENGIFNKAKLAEKLYINAQEEEKTYINEYDDINKYTNDSIKLTAEIVSFVSNNSNWNVKNVKEALDYLYNIGN